MSALYQGTSNSEINQLSGIVWLSFGSASLASAGGLILAGKLLAWGLRGIVFGVVADRLGRAKTMMRIGF